MQHTILSAKQSFFTVTETGENGISIRALSRLSGIPHPTIVRWFQSNLVHESVPDRLKALAGKELYLSHLVHEIKVRGKAIKPIRSEIAAEIIDYADDLGKPEARAALKSFAKIGLDSFIQGATGYLPEQYQASTRDPRHEIQRLIRDPNPWRRLYSKEVCDRVRSWYFPRDFFWKFAYSWMTAEETAFLNECNPVLEGSYQRSQRIFQHLSETTRKRLEPEIDRLCLLIETSTSKADFETRYARSRGMNQVELKYAN